MTRLPPADGAGVKLIFPLSILVAAALAALVASCGGDNGIVSIEEPGPPVGRPQLPDIAPGPPQDAHITHEDGRWLIRFSTMLANVGDGDFVLRATKGIRDWEVDQDVRYSESGAKVYRTPARLVWGGDGHDHWHVQRIAVGTLTPYDRNGAAPKDGEGLADAKVGFCYYDYARLEDDAPQNAVYPRQGCGVRNDTAIGMGLSWGWMDIYGFDLPGQSIDVTDLPDGKYRLWVEVDQKRWFHEQRRDNNVTWADLELVTTASGARRVRNVKSGPPIQLHS
jgi:lysyl oxidase